MSTSIAQDTRSKPGGDGRFAVESASRAPETAGTQYKSDTAGRHDGDGLASFLGWFSVGLGVAQLASPGGVARMIGVDDDERTRKTMRAIGARELAAGLGILSRPRPAGWVWSRVAGDAMDLALLGKAMRSDDSGRRKTAAAAAAVVGIAALDVVCAQQLTRNADAAAAADRNAKSTSRSISTRRSVTVRTPIEEVYRFWRNFENLPRFMRHLESVSVTGDRRSHWKAKAPAGMTVEWDAETTEDRPNELIAWRALENADVYNEGSVRFERAPGGRGTEVRVELRYEPPGGVIASKLAMLFREEPGQQVKDDLRRFKQVLETGDVVLSDASVFDGPHPARPPEKPINR